MTQSTQNPASNPKTPASTALLWIAGGILALGLLFARVVYPELLWLTIVIAVLLVGDLALLIQQNRKSLSGRAAQFGLNSAITAILVICILGVVNFMASRYPQKVDLTKNKIHTLSEETVKVVKGLQKPVKAVLFGKLAQRQKDEPLLDNYKALSPKFEVEYVDPDREPARAKQANVKKYGTLHLAVGDRVQNIEEPTEEKITNSMIKLLKPREQVLCAITGHGEKSFDANDAEGYTNAKKALEGQAYQVRDLNLPQETQIPDTCDAIAILGPNKAFFAPEVKAIQDYLAKGGHALIALDINVKGGGETSPELLSVLKDWHVNSPVALVVDPLSRMLGVDAAVPILATFSKDNPITKDFQGNCYFPFARPLESVSGAPAGMNVQWLAQTTPKSWAESNLKELSTGQVRFDPGSDKQGPLKAAMAVEGKVKDSKAPRNTRIVVFGTSMFATNNYARFGGNMDFFVNSVNWLMQDENLISIHTKEEGPGKVELTQKEGNAIGLFTIFVIPALIAVAGIVLWIRRKKL